MKRAAEADGADRQRLIQLALAWYELARDPRDEPTDLRDAAGQTPPVR